MPHTIPVASNTIMKIDTSSPVLVTGGTGYLAGVLIKALLAEGLTVHATVRDPLKTERLQYLKDVADASKGTLKFFQADLLEKGSFEEAMKGCSIVFHTASPFLTKFKDAQTELIEPAVNGTENVLNTASATPSVKRIVLTSSALAVYTDASDAEQAAGKVLTEDCWNRTSTMTYNPYALSKTLAEQKAWEIAGSQTQWTMVAINPTWILGPGLKVAKSNPSYDTIIKLGDGTMSSGTIALATGVVDVRDVAQAQVAAAYTPTASGRYLINGTNTDFAQLSGALKKKYPDYPVPTNKIPWWVLWLMGPFLPEPMPRQQVWNNVDVKLNVDNGKSTRDLGMKYRPMQETLEEMFQQLIEGGFLKKE